MPGFDGTGPAGQGPRTGGGRGFCSSGVNPTPFRTSPYGGFPRGWYYPQGYPYASGVGVGRGGFPRGGGRGRSFGGGRGRRWCW